MEQTEKVQNIKMRKEQTENCKRNLIQTQIRYKMFIKRKLVIEQYYFDQ